MKTVRIKNRSKEITIGKIVCVGRNYAEHAAELGNEVPERPVVFLKPASAVIYSGGEIIYPPFSKEMHHETELVLLVGKKLKDADTKESSSAIEAYGVGLDMTLRDVQSELKKKGHPWTIAKGFDTSAVLSDFVLASEHILTLEEEIILKVNGAVRQREKLGMMLFKPAQVLEYVSSLMTLDAGDLIFTGTPKGVNTVKPGDKLQASISGIAELECTVRG